MKKKRFVLEISRFLCFCEIHRLQNLWRHQRHCYILSAIKIIFGQILLCCMRTIPYMFLVQRWRLETSSRPFYDFTKITIWQDLAIFHSWHLPFLNVPYSPFQWNEILESWRDWLLSNWSRLLNWKGPGTLASVLQIVQKIPENCLYLSIGQVWWLNKLWFKSYIQKCTLSHVLILIMSHRLGKSWDG